MSPTCLLLFAATAAAQPDVPPLFKAYGPTVTYYYKSPEPALGPRMLNDLLRPENLNHPFFEKNAHVLTILAAQLGDIAAGKGEVVRQYEAAFAAAPAAGRKVILRALATCGDADTGTKVTSWLADARFADVRAELEALQKQLAAPKRPHVRDRPATTPGELDLLWANFFITGEYAPVARILDVFDLPDAPANAVLKRVAKWSLGSNLQQHPRLVELVEKHKAERPAGSRQVIDEVIVERP